jgi:predicted CoA-substrate-specific enzyme activase
MGIDIGSSRSKGLILKDGTVVASYECSSGGDFKVIAGNVRDELFVQTGLSSPDIIRTVATGYGSKQVDFASEMKSDLSCHSRGAHHLFSTVRTVIDVGDLYSKVFSIDGRGNLQKFLLSGKCAGGSGRVLQVIAKVLHVKVEEIGELSLRSKHRVDFNTGCVVFAESEAVSRVADGVLKEDLLAGIHRALAAQLNSLGERLGVEEDLALVGGGARDVGLVKALEEMTGLHILVPEEPHMTGALGAALIAEEMVTV